jgi:hypothetical protein
MPSAAFCSDRAVQAQSDADNATLDNVKERHLVARDAWPEMATKADAIMIARMKREGDKAVAQSLLRGA